MVVVVRQPQEPPAKYLQFGWSKNVRRVLPRTTAASVSVLVHTARPNLHLQVYQKSVKISSVPGTYSLVEMFIYSEDKIQLVLQFGDSISSCPTRGYWIHRVVTRPMPATMSAFDWVDALNSEAEPAMKERRPDLDFFYRLPIVHGLLPPPPPASECVVCMATPAVVLYRNCYHIVTCQACDWQLQFNPNCPSCRGKILCKSVIFSGPPLDKSVVPIPPDNIVELVTD